MPAERTVQAAERQLISMLLGGHAPQCRPLSMHRRNTILLCLKTCQLKKNPDITNFIIRHYDVALATNEEQRHAVLSLFPHCYPVIYSGMHESTQTAVVLQQSPVLLLPLHVQRLQLQGWSYAGVWVLAPHCSSWQACFCLEGILCSAVVLARSFALSCLPTRAARAHFLLWWLSPVNGRSSRKCGCLY